MSFDLKKSFAPVVHDITVRIVFVLLLTTLWHSEIIDVKGAFLQGWFGPSEKVFMEVPKGFQKYYPGDVVLQLKHTLYGVRNAVKVFWLVLVTLLGTFNILQSKADPCLYYKWTSAFRLIVVLSWIDDIMICGNKEGVLHYKKLLTEKIDCDDVGPLADYIGNKIDIDCKNCSMRVTQLVLLRSFKDEFNVEVLENCPTTPAAPGSVLRGTSEENTVGYPEQCRYRSGVGKLLYLMKWS